MTRLKILGIIVALIFVAGCATLDTGSTIRPEELTLAQFEAAYVAQWHDTYTMATDPLITPAQREIVRTKKDVLIRVRPLIDAYGAVVRTGGTPTIQQEQAIYQLLNSIGANITRK
ncbi:MAG: hypothetical protein A4E73_02430 [Syntrophaceae bacterium PtaU1.Bin231]|nr:MAG: hypothetical protein A4E73_02430 [Syntrophaceae bacterium PtaU1.Bin231]